MVSFFCSIALVFGVLDIFFWGGVLVSLAACLSLSNMADNVFVAV